MNIFYIWAVIFQLPRPRSGTGSVTVCYHAFRIWYLRFIFWVLNYLLVCIIYYFCISYFVKSFTRQLLSIRYLVSLFEYLFLNPHQFFTLMLFMRILNFYIFTILLGYILYLNFTLYYYSVLNFQAQLIYDIYIFPCQF